MRAISATTREANERVMEMVLGAGQSMLTAPSQSEALAEQSSVVIEKARPKLVEKVGEIVQHPREHPRGHSRGCHRFEGS